MNITSQYTTLLKILKIFIACFDKTLQLMSGNIFFCKRKIMCEIQSKFEENGKGMGEGIEKVRNIIF